jgi:hypothetical protein
MRIAFARVPAGAGDGNRTHVASLEGWSSTIELHPHSSHRPTRPLPLPASRPLCLGHLARPSIGGGGRIRTYEDVRRQIYSLLPLTTRQPLRGRMPPAAETTAHKGFDPILSTGLSAVCALTRCGRLSSRDHNGCRWPRCDSTRDRRAPKHRSVTASATTIRLSSSAWVAVVRAAPSSLDLPKQPHDAGILRSQSPQDQPRSLYQC